MRLDLTPTPVPTKVSLPSSGPFSVAAIGSKSGTPPPDRNLLAGVLYAESNPKDPQDMKNIADVIHNRASTLGTDPLHVVTYGFTSVGRDSSKRFEPFLKGNIDSKDASQRAYDLADQLLAGIYKPSSAYNSFTGNGKSNTYTSQELNRNSFADPNILRTRFSQPDKAGLLTDSNMGGVKATGGNRLDISSKGPGFDTAFAPVLTPVSNYLSKTLPESPLGQLVQGHPLKSLEAIATKLPKDFENAFGGGVSAEDSQKYFDINKRFANDPKSVSPQEIAFARGVSQKQFTSANNLVMGSLGEDLDNIASKIIKKLAPEAKGLLNAIKEAMPDINPDGILQYAQKAAHLEGSEVIQPQHIAEALTHPSEAPEAIDRFHRVMNIDVNKPIEEQIPGSSKNVSVPETVKPVVNETKVSELNTQIESLKSTLEQNPLNRLREFESRSKPGTLPEITGKMGSKFGKEGDQIVQEVATELGHPDWGSNEIRDAYEKFSQSRNELKSLQDLLSKEKNPTLSEYSPTQLEDINRKLQLSETKATGYNSDVSPIGEDRPLEIPSRETNKKLPEGVLTTTIPEKELPSFENIISPKTNSVKQKVNIFDYLRTPEKVLEKIGLGADAKLIREADELYKSSLKEHFDVLKGLRDLVPSPESATNIFKYLDGQEVKVSPAEQQVGDTLKSYLKEWADKLGLPEDKRITNYITHIFDRDLITKEFDPDLAKLITDKVPGSVYDPFLQERLGKMGFKENVWQALDAYVKRATRKVAFDPALEALSRHSQSLDLESLKYVTRFTANLNMRPTEIDNLLDNFIKSTPVGYKLGQRPTTVLTNTFRKWIYRGTLGLNFGSALRNLTQGVNTYAELGEKYTILGYIDLLKKETKELFENHVLDDNLATDRTSPGIIKKIGEKVDKTLFSLFDTVEKINRGSAYYGAKKSALAKGLSEEEAIKYGKSVVRKTQFSFGKVDTPVALGSDLTKTLAQFQTFNVKQGEFLSNMMKEKDFAGLIRWTGASLLTVYTIGQALGMSWRDLIPTIRLGGSPLGNIASGITDQFSPNTQTRSQGISKIKNVGWQLIPAGSQIHKSILGIQAAGKRGAGYLRGALFGKYTFPQSTGTKSSGHNRLSL